MKETCSQHGGYTSACPRCTYDAHVAEERQKFRREIAELQRRCDGYWRELVYLRGPVRDDVSLMDVERDLVNAMVASQPTMVLDTSLVQRWLGRFRLDAARIGEAVRTKDGAYEERNRLVAVFARLAISLGWVAGVGEHHDEPGKEWDADWRTLVVVETPEGQASWHFHDSHRHLLEGLPRVDLKWDGHDTKTKYERLARLATSFVARSVGQPVGQPSDVRVEIVEGFESGEGTFVAAAAPPRLEEVGSWRFTVAIRTPDVVWHVGVHRTHGDAKLSADVLRAALWPSTETGQCPPKCPICARPAVRLEDEVQGKITDCIGCDACGVDFVRLGRDGRWFEGGKRPDAIRRCTRVREGDVWLPQSTEVNLITGDVIKHYDYVSAYPKKEEK